jgi:hypothetical protein
MSKEHRDRDDDRALVRDALRAAPGPEEPDVTRLLEAVPALMAEARRRRSAVAAPDLASALAERARRAIPKLAVATAVVVVLASTASLVYRETPGNGTGSFDSLVLSGDESNGGDAADILLDAVTKGDQLDG